MAHCFEWKDTDQYDDLWDAVISGSAVVKGEPVVKQDSFGFYMNDGAVGDEVIILYTCRQVTANKKTGSGEAILSGDRLYYFPATNNVSPNKGVTPGTDYYYCGTAKKDAGASAATVDMRFDGTRYDENV